VTTTRQITADLRSLGIAEGISLVVHSSLSSLGRVEDGADAVIDALLEALGERGTLVMPTFTFPPEPVFDPRSTRSTTGLIAETFRARAGVVRSLHPTHSVAALGSLAKHFVEGHPDATALGVDSPLHRLAVSDGFVLLLGVQHTSNAMVHVGEAVARAPYLDIPYSDAFNVSIPVRMPDGEERIVLPRENPGCSVNFNAVEEPLNAEAARIHPIWKHRRGRVTTRASHGRSRNGKRIARDRPCRTAVRHRLVSILPARPAACGEMKSSWP